VTTDIIARLAKACAHGKCQLALVEELLEGPAYINRDYWGFKAGKAGVGGESFRSLKKRLKENGFIVTVQTWKDAGDKPRRIEMKFVVDFTSS
jgi:hypothetical protein